MTVIAAIQKVQVTNWPQRPPSLTPTPTPEWTLPLAIPHVDVSWATFWITVVGILTAGVALYIAIKAAAYAKSAWMAAEADLKISKANWDISQRSPSLAASFVIDAPHEVSVQHLPTGRRVTYSLPILRALVFNTAEGTRRCDAFYVEIVIPIEALSKPEQARLSTEKHYGFLRQARVYNDVPIYPGSQPVGVEFSLTLDYPAIARELTLEYRIKDDYHDYPAEGYLKTTVRFPSRPQLVFVNPRDEAESRMYQTIFDSNLDEQTKAEKYAHAFEMLELKPGPYDNNQRMKDAETLARQVLSI